MSDTNTSGDSSELEALFDSIASGVTPPAVAPTPAPAPAPKPSLMQQARENDGSAEDSQDLQDLFDSIAQKQQNAVASASDTTATTEGSDAWPAQDKVFKQVGLMARQLHDTLGALGYDKLIEKTVSAIPDARDRLAYIANLTEQAACKVLNATDIANPLQEELEEGAVLLANKWDALYANKLTVEEFKLLASETRAYLKNAVPQRTSATKDQLMEIMMAQDFQDLDRAGHQEGRRARAGSGIATDGPAHRDHARRETHGVRANIAQRPGHQCRRAYRRRWKSAAG
jgi:chemotaxis protein CheZ